MKQSNTIKNDFNGFLFDWEGTAVPSHNPMKGLTSVKNCIKAIQDKLTYHMHIDAFLTWLNQNGKKTAVVTSASKKLFEMFLKSNAINNIAPIMEYFDTYVVKNDTTETKPSGLPWLEAMHRLGLNIDESIAFENSAKGAKSVLDVKKLTGKKLALCAVNAPGKKPNEFLNENADFAISDYKEIL